MTLHLHEGDLPEGLAFGPVLAIDTEAMGLNPHRDRLCLAQMTDGAGDVHLVRFPAPPIAAPRLSAVLADPRVLKLFHFARFDLALIGHYLGVIPAPVYCTKVASKLVRTYTDKHGLKDLARDLAGADLSKQQQSSDWGAPSLTHAQLEYAASDVVHLHKIKAELDRMLAREGRTDLAEACFAFLPTRARLDLLGWEGEGDVFEH